MSKIVLTLVLVGIVAATQAMPSSYDDIIAAAKSGNWDHVHQLINSDLANNPDWKASRLLGNQKMDSPNKTNKPISFHSVRNLKPPQGGHVYGEAEYTFQSASNINGQKSEHSGGHKVINDDGKVQEYDLNPKL